MRVVDIGSGIVRRPPIERAPEVELLLGDGESDALAAAHISIPPGGGMPEHDHGDSAAVVAVQKGRVILRSGGEERILAAGTLAVIEIGERVSLENADAKEASLLAFFTPPTFAGTVASWPTTTSASR